jgi:hypothetical protein
MTTPRLVPILPIAFLACILASASGLAAGCGSSSAGAGSPPAPDAATESSVATGDDAGGAADVVEAGTAAYPAFVPTDIPQVANLKGGPVLSLPKVYPIYFASDDPTFTAQITDFLSKVGATTYWNTVASEYGVGSLVAEAPIQLTAADNPPAVYYDAQIRTWLTEKLSGDDAGATGFPTPDENTLFAFFFPSGVTITEQPLPSVDAGTEDAGVDPSEASCTAFGGYHNTFRLANGVSVSYAVVPRCSSFDGFTGVDAVTAAASHELLEGVTDPYITAFSSTDVAHRYWATLVGGGGEIGDMCAQTLSSFTHFPELPAYLVQRCWSNKTALTGGDPCVPIPTGDVYFNSIPVMPDVLEVVSGRGDGGPGPDGGPTAFATKGVKIAVGASKTIELDLFSNVPTSGDWTVTAYDLDTLAQQTPQLLQFSFDKSHGHNGDKLQMTIKVLAAGPHNTEPFIISSMIGNTETSPQNIWAGIVGT